MLAGKTTLVNWILAQKAGRRVAVVENEFGEVNIDRALGKGSRVLLDGVRGFAGDARVVLQALSVFSQS